MGRQRSMNDDGASRAGELSRRRLLGIAGAGAVTLALAGCGSDDDDVTVGGSEEPGGGLEGRTISVALYSKNHASSPLFWQQFAPEGLTVEPQIFTSGSDMNRAMEAGDLDFGLMGPYNSLIEAEQGFGSKIICMCSRQGIGLVARSDRGIESVADLAGKTIAVPPPGVQVLVLTALLEEAGLQLDRDLTSVPLGYADHAAALERGDVDAFMGTEPPVTTSVVSGVGRRVEAVYSTPTGDFNTAMWAAPHVQDDAELLEAVVAMQRDSAEHLTPGGQNDPQVWRDLLVDQFGYPEPVYEEVLSNIGAEWRFEDRRRSQLEGAGQMMLSSGILTREPDFEALYLLDHLPEQ